MDNRLEQAIQMRAAGQYAEAKALLLTLYAERPEDARVNYYCAWVHDNLGEERAAAPFYERAIATGLSDEDLRGALLGLGSTYRTLGQYEQARDTLLRGMERFPDAHEFPTFLAMAYYNLGEHHAAMTLLLRALAQTSTDSGVQRLKRAILAYSEDLDEMW